MNFITSKVFTIAIGIVATLAIASSVIILLSYVLDIYSAVSKIDYNLMSDIDDYQRFNVTSYNGDKFTSTETLTGIEILNMISKFKYDDKVSINGYVKVKDGNNQKLGLYDDFKSSDSKLRANYYCAVIKNTDEEVKIIFNEASN